MAAVLVLKERLDISYELALLRPPHVQLLVASRFHF